MSRFFATGSDSESDVTSSDEEVPQRQAVAPRTYQFEDEEEETRRVVRSAKDKRFDELRATIRLLKNHKKIKDMANVLDDFEALGKGLEKAKKVIEQEGMPRFYIRCLVELEDYITELWEDRDGRKNMSKNNAKSLTTLRQKLRKYNKDFEKDIAAYRENPDDVDAKDSEDQDSESESEKSDESEPEEVTVPTKDVQAPEQEDDDSDDDYFGFSDEDTTSSSEEDEKFTGQLTADYFRKKTTDLGDEEKKKKKEEKMERKKEKERKRDESDEEEGDQDGWQVKGGSQAVKEKPKMFAKDAEINHDTVNKKIRDLTSSRGKKATDRYEIMDMLVELRRIAKEKNLGDPLDVKILFRIIEAIFDYNPNIATNMRSHVWEKCMTFVSELLDELTAHKEDIICAENVEHDAETFTGEPPYRIRGCIITLVERLDDEYLKMLQSCDAHSTEYVARLKDEFYVCEILDKLTTYCDGRATNAEQCRLYLKQIHHIYYKFDYDEMRAKKAEREGKKTEDQKPEETTEKKSEETSEEKSGETSDDKSAEEKESPAPKESSKEIMDRLCKFIYAKDTTDRIRTQAILCHIYHHAMHDRWFEARDLMLMSHLQDTIQHSDIPTQIMYNRAMVQLGLCAFREGMIKDAHSCLVDIQSSGRAKELLAQGLLLQRQHERTPEQEKIEKRRQKPYHMHINLELLECVYLVSAMLLEIPYMAAHEFDARRRMISKNFHHVLRMSERQTLVGPPESMREHVVAASKAMKIGDWSACKEYLINDKMNAKVWDLFFNADTVRNLIIQKVKEESLRTYLFSYSSVYDSLDLGMLAEMFDLDRASSHSIISKMIINEELMASLDEPTKAVIMHRTEPTRLQSLALQLSEKVSSLMENNEKMVEMKQGGFYQRQGQQGGYQGDQRQQGGYQRDGYRRDGQSGYRGGRDGQSGYRGGRGGYRRDGQSGYRRDGQNQGGYNNRRGGYRGGYNRNDNRDGDRYKN